MPRHEFRIAVDPRHAKASHYNDDGSLKYEYRITQFPVIPGWAISIPESQVGALATCPSRCLLASPCVLFCL